MSTSLLSHPLRDSLVSDSAEMGRLSPMLKLRSDPSGKRSDLLRRERGRSEVRLEVGATEYEATMDSLAAAPSRVDMAVARLVKERRGRRRTRVIFGELCWNSCTL